MSLSKMLLIRINECQAGIMAWLIAATGVCRNQTADGASHVLQRMTSTDLSVDLGIRGAQIL